MNRVLRKRLPRDLRAGWGRYLALILVIAMGIYLVIGIVGSAETVLHGTEEKRSVFNTQDGFFTVFLPLTDKDMDMLTEDGTTIWAEFYTDLTVDRDTKLRMFKNREDIDKLILDEGRLYSVTSKADIEKSSGVFVEQMGSLIYTLMTAGTVIFIVVMYLMMGVMIDRSAFGISLIKIFGYRPREVRSLYLNGNLTIVSVGALICIPLAKFIIDSIYPSFICNVACSMTLDFPPYLYLIIYGAVLAVYFVSSAMLTRKLSRITPAEVLKNRE